MKSRRKTRERIRLRSERLDVDVSRTAALKHSAAIAAELQR